VHFYIDGQKFLFMTLKLFARKGQGIGNTQDQTARDIRYGRVSIRSFVIRIGLSSPVLWIRIRMDPKLFVGSGSLIEVSDPGPSPKLDVNMYKNHQEIN
jgi:hypothetical protein